MSTTALDGESPSLRRSRRLEKKIDDTDGTKAAARTKQEPSVAKSNAQSESKVKSLVNWPISAFKFTLENYVDLTRILRFDQCCGR